MTSERGFAISGLRAVRTRKARRDDRCALCPCPVVIGQRIALIPGTGWSHVSCVIRARNQQPKEIP